MPLNVKKLKLETQKWKNFKIIMKIMYLDEVNKLKKITDVYNNNFDYFCEQKKLIQNIETEISFNKKSRFFIENHKPNSSLYILSSPEKINSTTKAMLKKTKEFLSGLNKKNSFFVTFGFEANKICNRLDLKIVDSFEQFDVDNDSINKISSIVSLGISNQIFDDVYLLFPEVTDNGDLFVSKIIPFKHNDHESSDELFFKEKSTIKDSASMFDVGEVKNMQWFPSIDSAYAHLVESLISLKTNVIILKHKIIRQKEIVNQAKDKNVKIDEHLKTLSILIQKSRKEQITLELLSLSTAFKLLNQNDQYIRNSKNIKDKEREELWLKEINTKIKTMN